MTGVTDEGKVRNTMTKLNVKIDRIFDKHNHIDTFQGIGYFLYSERIYRCSCPDPQHINTVFKSLINVLFICHLGTDKQSCFLFDIPEPSQSLRSNSLE